MRLSRTLAALAATAIAAVGLIAAPAAASAAPLPINCSGDALIEKSFDNGADWRMCWHVDSKRGLVLEQIDVEAPGESGYRRVLDSLALGQLHVPYDTGENLWNDLTEYGFGNQYLQKLDPAECRTGELRDVAQNFTIGRRVPVTYMRTIPALCITDTTRPLAYRSHEQHWGDPADAPLFTAEGQGFSVQTISKVDWYEYATRVDFTDEGAITMNLGATGDISYEDFDASPVTGWPVGQGASEYASSHWHNAIWRLDFGLDGADTQYVEQYDTALSGETGEMAPVYDTVPHRVEHPANLTPDSQLTWWRVVAPDSLNANEHARSYEFVFPATQTYGGDPLTQPLITFTNYSDCEVFASQNIPPACPDQTILDYVAGTADQELTDPVAWVNSGFHHIVRDEDQSPMPTHWQSFTIQPRDWTAQSMSTPAGRVCIDGDPGGEIHTDKTPCVDAPPVEPTDPGTPEPTDPATPAPVEPTETAPAPAGDGTPTAGAPGLTLSAGAVAAGDELGLSGSGFAPGESVSVTLHSDPVDLGTFTADDDGVLDAEVTIPADTPAGEHTIEVAGASGTATAALTVSAAAVADSGSGSSSLAHTGFAVGAWIGGAVLLLGAGAVLLFLRRRAAAEHTATAVTAEA